MNENAVIKISGLQKVEGTADNIEMIAAGKHYLRKNKHYILYDNFEEDSKEQTSNIIKFNNDMVEIIRKGAVEGRLLLQENAMKQSVYSTPMGDMLVEIMTEEVLVDEQEDGNVDLKVKYQIHIDGNKISDNELEINAIHHQ